MQLYLNVKITAVVVVHVTIPNGQVPAIAPIPDITRCIAIPAAQVVAHITIQEVMHVIHHVQMQKMRMPRVVFI